MMAVRTWSTGPANAAHSGKTLVVRLESAIRRAAAKVVMGTPVCRCRSCDAGDSERSDHEQRGSHGQLLALLPKTRLARFCLACMKRSASQFLCHPAFGGQASIGVTVSVALTPLETINARREGAGLNEA
jgi:hypothetical protein